MKMPAVTPRRSRLSARRAFTLLELLIVLGVLAILMSLLLPSVGKARVQARQVVCASQLKQIYQASAAWQFRQGNDVKDFDAAGWRAKLSSYLAPKVYLCPEAQAGAMIEVPGAPSSDNGSVAKGNLTPTLAVHIVNTNYDIPCVPGPWVLLEDVSGNSYTLNFEDQATAGENGGDKSYNNVKLRFTDNGDGSVTVTILASFGGYTSNLIDSSTNKTIYSNIGQGSGSVNVGKTVTLSNDPNSPNPINLAVSGGPPTNYGMNQNVGYVYGKADKIFALDYSKSVAFVSDDWQTPAYLNSQQIPTFARHMKKANICWCDGHVDLNDVTKTKINPSYVSGIKPENLVKYWNPK